MVNGLAAAQWLLNLDSVSPGLCLNYVWRAYAAQGASTDMSAGTAKSAWDQSDGKHWGDRNPPAGAAVWWGTRYDGNDDGDVTISLGGGRVAATDYPGWRQTGSCTIDEREAQVGREYLGWTSSIFDCPIDLGGTGGNASASWNRTSRSTVDIQRLVGANPDGVYGPETDAKIRAWQAANRLDADGIFGVLCEAVGFSIAVDGDPGVQTYAKLQHRVGATIDGQLGAETWGKLQAALGVPSDGIPGPVTYSALQTAVGATVDGQIGPDTWMRTQAYLNTGNPFRKVGVVTPPAPPAMSAPPRPNDDPAVPGVWLGKWSENREARTGRVQYFVVHHAADTRTPDVQVQRFMSPNDREVSPTWFVGADGIARKIVHPDDRQWTTGRIIDQQAITVETQNTTGDPAWGISDAAHEQIAELVAWAAKRYGFPIDRAHVLGHEEAREKLDMTIPATACPGPSMDLDRIVKRAQEIAALPVDPNPDPGTPSEPPADLSGIMKLLQQILDFLKGLFGGGK